MSPNDYEAMKPEAIKAIAEVIRVLAQALPVADKAALEIANLEVHEPATIPGGIVAQAKTLRYQLAIISQKLDALENIAQEPAPL